MPWFMKKNARVPKDRAKDIPDDFKGFYKEDGDDFVLDDAQMKTIDIIDGLNNTNVRLRSDVDNLRSSVDLSGLSEYGSDVASIKAKFDETIAALKAEVKDKGGKNIDFEKAKADLIAERDRLVKEANDKTAATSARMHTYVKENALRAALAEHGGNPTLLLPVLMGQTDVVEDGETFRTVIKGADGKHRTSATNGELLGVGDFVRELKNSDDYAPAFKSDAPSGGPTLPSNGGGSGAPAKRTTAKEMTARDKVAAGLAAMGKK